MKDRTEELKNMMIKEDDMNENHEELRLKLWDEMEKY